MMYRSPNSLLIVFLLCTGWSQFVMAQYFKSPAAESLGGTSVAGPDTHDCLFTNPAIIPFSESIEAGAYYVDNRLIEGESSSARGVQLTDNTENLVAPGGIAYIEKSYQGPLAHHEKAFALGVAYPIYPLWTMGISGLHVNYQSDETRYQQTDATFGVLHTPRPWFGFAYVLQNFTRPASALPEPFRLPLQHVLGFNYLWSDFLRLRIDLRYQEENNPRQKWIEHLGVETIVGQFFAFRVGGEWDDLNGVYLLTAGVGFKGPRLRLNYSFRMRGQEGMEHGIDLRLPL